MSEVKNYYEILGLDKNASDKDIKKAYRKLAAKWHPDKFANASEAEKKEAEEKFKEINEANSILSDPEKKSNYDQFGDPNGNPMSGFGGFGGFDPFEGFDPFGGHFGQREPRERVERGGDLRIFIDLTLEETFTGCKKTIKYQKQVSCSHCNGTGSEDGKKHECEYCHGTGRVRVQQQRGNMTMIQETMCPHCHGTGVSGTINKCKKCGGTGFEYTTVTETFEIPAGVDSGMAITKEGYGNEPTGKGINGDLYIVFRVKDDQRFTRDGNDLYANVNVNLEEAWCGCEKTVECIDNTKINVKIPELSEDGKVLRVQGKGMKDLRSGLRGNLYLKIKYIVPKSLSKEQKELLKKFYNE